MSHYTFLAFFKHSKIDYRYLSKENIIIFPCFNCGQEGHFFIDSSLWHCQSCSSSGPFTALLRSIQDNGNVSNNKVYHPEKEQDKLLKTINKLKAKNPSISSKLEEIETAMTHLITYYKKQIT